MREILTGDFIYEEARRCGLDASFIYLCDDIDPLRKMYPFLPPEYEKYVGMPLYKIPSPDGDGSYASHFIRPFLDTLDTISVKVDVIETHTLYEQGKFADLIDTAILNRKRIAEILSGTSGRGLGDSWYPYTAACAKCGKMTTTKVTSYSRPYADYTCSCGHSGKADIRTAEGKMPWRVEWPAKWSLLGVTVEPFGKDHGAAGGSYDTGKLIAKQVFNVEPPKPLMYEWITLKGKGAMHSSTGVAIAASDFIKMAPAEILRFLIARNQPSRHIEFDPGNGLLNLVDEFEKLRDDCHSWKADEDALQMYELSRIGEVEDLSGISFRHLITIVQIYSDSDGLLTALRRSGYEGDSISDAMADRIALIKNWLVSYAPEQIRFSISPVDKKVVLTETQKEIIGEFLGSLENIEWSPESLHNTIHEIIGRHGVEPGAGFSTFYQVLIGKERGPRLGYFLSNMDRGFVKKRFSSVL